MGEKQSSQLAIEFLRHMLPEGPWVLTAINPAAPKGAIKTKTRTFGPGSKSNAITWIDHHNGKWNLYFTGNGVRQPMFKKPERADISELRFLHVDIDPAKDKDLAEERKRIEALLLGDGRPQHVPIPTVTVFSGGGLQAFWKLKEPLRLDGTLEQAEKAKLWNKELEHLLGGDSCHNIDRIMRLPGTINVPTKKKLEGGRKPALAVVVEADWSRDYDLSAFTPAQPSAHSGTTQPATAESFIDDILTPIASLEALDQWNVPSRIKTIIEIGYHPEETSKPHGDRSLWVFDVVCALVRCKVPDTTIFSVLTDTRFKISDRVLEQRNIRKYVLKELESAKCTIATEQPNTPASRDDDATWRKLAGVFVSSQKQRLLRCGGSWFSYFGGAYKEREDEAIRALVYDQFPKFGASKVSNLLDAAKGLVLREAMEFAPPCWLDGRNGPDPRQLLVVRNGMVNIATGELLPHDPELFTFNALDYDYDADAVAPARWLRFVNEVFHEDCRDLVQQICGYLLTPDTSRQAIFVFVGAAGSGKSTLGRVLLSILGNRNVCSPSLSGLGTQFGQQVLIGKQLALISEMKLDHRDNKEAIARVLLNISGEDPIAIPRKNLTDWEGRLGVRIVILANGPPSLDELIRRFAQALHRHSDALFLRWQRGSRPRNKTVGREVGDSQMDDRGPPDVAVEVQDANQ